MQQYHIHFNVNTVITKINLANLEEFVDWLISEKIKFLFTFARKNLSGDSNFLPSNQELTEVLLKIYKNLQTADLNYGYFPEISSCLANKIPLFYKNRKICGMGSETLILNQKGDIFPCQMLISYEEYKIGNLLNQENMVLENLRNNKISKLNLPVEERSRCSNCEWRYVCRGGNCPLDSFWHFSCENFSSYYCSTFKAIIPEAIKLEAERLLRYRNQ